MHKFKAQLQTKKITCTARVNRSFCLWYWNGDSPVLDMRTSINSPPVDHAVGRRNKGLDRCRLYTLSPGQNKQLTLAVCKGIIFFFLKLGFNSSKKQVHLRQTLNNGYPYWCAYVGAQPNSGGWCHANHLCSAMATADQRLGWQFS